MVDAFPAKRPATSYRCTGHIEDTLAHMQSGVQWAHFCSDLAGVGSVHVERVGDTSGAQWCTRSRVGK